MEPELQAKHFLSSNQGAQIFLQLLRISQTYCSIQLAQISLLHTYILYSVRERVILYQASRYSTSVMFHKHTFKLEKSLESCNVISEAGGCNEKFCVLKH